MQRFLQFDAQGHCECATPDAQALFERIPQLIEAIGECVRALHASGRARQWCLPDDMACEIVRMETNGDGAATRYLAIWHATYAAPTGATEQLTHRQLEVARFAAAGATVDEIASALSISPNTVKSHLKRIYDQLDVGSRVELAAALGTT